MTSSAAALMVLESVSFLSVKRDLSIFCMGGYKIPRFEYGSLPTGAIP